MPAEHPTLSSMLLAGVQDMDSGSWSRLVNTFGPIVYRWCRTSGVPPADAADVVQEVFTAVARAIGQFQRDKPQGSFRAWLATITRNKVRDYFRRAGDRQAAVGGTEPMLQLQQLADDFDSTISSDHILSPLAHQILRQVRAEFEPTTWQAFWLTTVEEQPAADVAQTVGISIASVYQAKSRILRRLRQRMEEF